MSSIATAPRDSQAPIRAACAELERRLRSGEACRAEDILRNLPLLAADSDAVLELIYTEFALRERLGTTPETKEYFERFPELRKDLEELFQVHKTLAGGLETISLNAKEEPPEILDRRFGEFELIHELGRGGMGVVYKARDLRLGRIVALKMVLAGTFAGPLQRSRFRAEAEAAAQLDHPNIISIFEVGEHENQPFFTMRLIEGGSLAHHLASFVGNPRATAEMIRKVADAIHHAHQRGVLHRDLKPANILLEAAEGKGPEEWTPSITDFGLARRVQGKTHLTQSASLVGTLTYMAPEQAGGTGQHLTTAVDIYSLGVILYECLTGRVPFDVDSALDAIMELRHSDPVHPTRLRAELPRDLETICLKCLEKEPAKRYATAGELAADLRRFLNGEPIRARPLTGTEILWRWAKRNVTAATIVSASLVTSFLLLIGGVWHLWTLDLAYQEVNQKHNDAIRARQKEYEARTAAEQALKLQMLTQANGEILACNLERAHELLDQCKQETPTWDWRFLKRMCRPNLETFDGPRQALRCVTASPDGRWLACGEGVWASQASADVWLWDLENPATPPKILKGHTMGLKGIAFHPQGKIMVTASDDGSIRLWSIPEGECTVIPGDPVRPVWIMSVAFSPDGKYLGTANGDGWIEIREFESRQLVKKFRTSSHAVFSLAFLPDNKRLFAGSWDRSAVVWDFVRGKELQKYRTDGDLRTVSVSFDGKYLAGGCFDGTIWVWETGGSTAPIVTCSHPHHAVHAIAFHPDGRHLAAGDHQGFIRVWAIPTGREIVATPAHSGSINGLGWHPHGDRLFSCGNDRLAKMWEAFHAPHRPTTFRSLGGNSAFDFLPDSQQVVLASKKTGQKTTLPIFELAPVFAAAQVLPINTPTLGFSLSHKSGWIASVHSDRVVRIWDSKTRALLKTLPHTNEVVCVALDPNGNRLISIDKKGNLYAWGADTGTLQTTVNLAVKGATSVHFHPSAFRFLIAEEAGFVSAWSVESSREETRVERLGRIKAHAERVQGIAVSPNGRWWATAGSEDGVALWPWEDLEKGIPTCRLNRPNQDARAVAFDPQGERLVVLAPDGEIGWWDLEQKTEFLTMHANLETKAIGFSPDGRRLGVMGDYGIALWHANPDQPKSLEQKLDDAKTRYAAWVQQKAVAFQSARDWRVAAYYLQKQKELDPDRPGYAFRRATVFGELKDWERSREEYDAFLKIEPNHLLSQGERILLEAALDNDAEFRKRGNAWFDRHAPNANRATAGTLGYILILRPAAISQPERLSEMTRRFANENAVMRRLHGAALYRAGAYNEAAKAFEISKRGYRFRAWDHLFMAMIRHHQKRPTQAQEHFQQALTWIEQADDADANPTKDKARIWFGYSERLQVRLLRREAAALLPVPTVPTSPWGILTDPLNLLPR